MERVGYWKEDGVGQPQDYVDDRWVSRERYRVINHLKAGMMHEGWMGYAGCRFGCDIKNGALCLTDGTWQWPEGYAHYIEKHAVRPPEAFEKYVLGLSDPVNLSHHVAEHFGLQAFEERLPKIHRVGFWARKGIAAIRDDPDLDTHWPWLHEAQGKLNGKDAAEIAGFLARGTPVEFHYDGMYEGCELVGQDGCQGEARPGRNSGSFRTDGHWIWPNDYAHLVGTHRVDVPPMFRSYVLHVFED